MNQDDATDDPFTELAEWAAKTERKERNRLRRRIAVRWLPVICGGLAAVVLLGVAVPQMFSSVSGARGAYPKATVPDGVSVTTTQSAAPTDPFEGTPAADYPKGAAGISLPSPAAVEGYPAAQVGTALQQVRTALIAARLDQRMLVGHDPAGLVALLAPNDRAQVAKNFTEAKFGTFATWIDPAARLDPAEQPRVSGRVTYASTVVDGVRTLRVITNMVWVYAFDQTARPLVAVHDEIRWDFPAVKTLRAGDRGMWLGDSVAYAAWADCPAWRRDLLAPSAGVTGPGPLPTEDPNALLRPDHALDIGDDCD
jgi:hypothetical protein